jgi:hypothetical protein
MLGTLHELRGYERKRIIPKIRYRAGRLAYLASRDQLASLGEDLRMVDELRFHAATLLAIATGDVTDVIRLGANVAQAVAQPLHAEDRAATVQGPIKGDVELHGLAVLALNGVEVSGGRASEYTDDEFLRFAHSGADREHLRSKDAFIREFAALHGVDAGQRHALTLDSAFDAAEDSVFDALGQAIYLPSEW